MLTAQRHHLIQTELAAHGRVISGDLARRFDLSEDTIRRDLRHLSKQGLCQRVYGGAVAPTPGQLHKRHDYLSEEKKALAARAVGLIEKGQTILIDAGSTNSAISRILPADLGLTVATNAPDIVTILSQRSDINLIVLGGQYDVHTGACTGPATEAAISALCVDLLFLGSCGVDETHGMTAFDPAEAAAKQAMLSVSAHVAVAVTQDKLATSAPYRICPADGVHTMITDQPAGELSGFTQQGVTIR